MNKAQILSKLRDKVGNNSIRLPRDIDFLIESGILHIQIKKEFTYKNMQTDAAAFEGWAVVLKNWLDEVSKVKLSWEEPNISEDCNEMQHYQRFLYRASNFKDAYDWFEINSRNTPSLQKLKIKPDGKYFLNSPSKERERAYPEKKPIEEYTEHELEQLMVGHPMINKWFLHTFDLKFVDNQLPVGVFKNDVSRKNRIFTGGKSAIDIWGISKDGKTCHIFELKDAGNRKVGALTEMFFYGCILKDIMNGVLRFNSFKYQGLNAIIQSQKVKAHLIAPNKHLLIEETIFTILNKSQWPIEFEYTAIQDQQFF